MHKTRSFQRAWLIGLCLMSLSLLVRPALAIDKNPTEAFEAGLYQAVDEFRQDVREAGLKLRRLMGRVGRVPPLAWVKAERAYRERANQACTEMLEQIDELKHEAQTEYRLRLTRHWFRDEIKQLTRTHKELKRFLAHAKELRQRAQKKAVELIDRWANPKVKQPDRIGFFPGLDGPKQPAPGPGPSIPVPNPLPKAPPVVEWSPRELIKRFDFPGPVRLLDQGRLRFEVGDLRHSERPWMKEPFKARRFKLGFKIRAPWFQTVGLKIDGQRYSYIRGAWRNRASRIAGPMGWKTAQGVVDPADAFHEIRVEFDGKSLDYYYNGQKAGSYRVRPGQDPRRTIRVAITSHHARVQLKDFWLQRWD